MKIKSWEDVEGALACIAEHESQIAQGKAMVDDAKEEIAGIEPHLEEFVRDHAEDLQERSRALDSGRVWLRKASRLVLVGKTSWKKVLAALVDERRMNLVRIKREVDKEALDQLSDERLGELKIRRDTKDAFGYETA